MSIRHKANFVPHLTEIDIPHSHQPLRPHNLPSTPQFIANPQSFSKLYLTHEHRPTPSQGMLGIKEHNIKSIDEKINSIMRKHERKEEHSQARVPLKQKNTYKGSWEQKIANTQASSTGKKGSVKVSQPKTSAFDQQNRYEGYEAFRKPRERSMTVNQNSYKKAAAISYDVQPLRQGKKYDNEINILNERIKQAEEEKRKLNIHFNPFGKTPGKEKRTTSSNQGTSIQLNGRQHRPVYDHETLKNEIRQLKASIIEPQGFIKPKKHDRQERNDRSINKNLGSISIDADTSCRMSSYTVSEILKSQQLTHKPKKTSNQHTLNLVDALIEQIRLDEEFRNLKIWFTFTSKVDKWQYLRDTVVGRNMNISIQELKPTFESAIEEHNPFFKGQGIAFIQGVEKMLQAYQACQSHWRQNILKRFSKSNLQFQNIRELLLYDSRSQQINMEDLVRFINMSKDKAYRNRDLFLIYRRLRGKTMKKVQYGLMMEQLTTSYNF